MVVSPLIVSSLLTAVGLGTGITPVAVIGVFGLLVSISIVILTPPNKTHNQ